MDKGRVWAVSLRYFYFFARLDHLCDLLFWPALDIVLWGLTSVWIQNQGGQVSDIALAVLTGLVFWQLVWRGNYEITVNLLQEFWNRNMVNLFSTPLKFSEWIASLMCVGLAKIFVSLLYGGLLVYLFYALNIFSVGWAILPFVASLLLSGWFIGFLSASVIVYFGQRVQTLAWMTAYIFAPFSAVFYPLASLPSWMQPLAKTLPMTYVFEGMRQVLHEGQFSLSMFLVSILLNLFYLAFSIALFKLMFELSRGKGLSRLE